MLQRNKAPRGAEPFGRRIAETGNSNSARQTTFDSRLDQIGCEEGERDRHVDFADTALLARGDLFDICCSASGDFIEPAPTAVNSGDPLNVAQAVSSSPSFTMRWYGSRSLLMRYWRSPSRSGS